jgi:hypothetical protein
MHRKDKPKIPNKRIQSDKVPATRVIGGWDESPFRVDSRLSQIESQRLFSPKETLKGPAGLRQSANSRHCNITTASGTYRSLG